MIKYKVPSKVSLDDVDLGYISDLFLLKYYNQPSPAYGHWVTREDWASLRPYGDRRQGHFHPSSGLTKSSAGCPRQVILDLLHAPRSPQLIPQKLAKVLDNGTNRHVGLHVLFMGMASKRWMGVTSYVPERRVVHPVLPIEGTLDGDLGVGGRKLVLDYKTLNPTEHSTLRKAKSGHCDQVNTYRFLLAEEGCDRDEGYLVYENKATQQWASPLKAFRSGGFSSGFRDDVWEYCTDILEMANARKLPKFDEAVCKASVMFCAYRTVCEGCKKGAKVPDNRPEATKRKHLRVFA